MANLPTMQNNNRVPRRMGHMPTGQYHTRRRQTASGKTNRPPNPDGWHTHQHRVQTGLQNL